MKGECITKNKVEVKMFLDREVRVIGEENVPLLDVFNALGRLTKEGKIDTKERRKVKELQDLDIICGSATCTLTSNSKNKNARKTQEVECIKLYDIPLLLTQFKPTAKAAESALLTWASFMRFVNELLKSLEVSKYIVKDKQVQIEEMERLVDAEGSPVVANKQVNIIMAKLVDVYDKGIKSLSKDDLRLYQDQTTVDLLDVRKFVMDKFVNAYEFTHSHKESAAMAYKLAYDTYFKQLVA